MRVEEEFALRPCPFCGGEAEVLYHQDETYSVECTCVDCDVNPRASGYLRSRDAAIDAWNTRAENNKLREEIEDEAAENKWAREFLNGIANKIKLANARSLVNYTEIISAENAKLRELVDYMTPIAWYGASERERDRMRELGVEV